jgi:hypothetical protein
MPFSCNKSKELLLGELENSENRHQLTRATYNKQQQLIIIIKIIINE